jgi:hypothetical protein
MRFGISANWPQLKVEIWREPFIFQGVEAIWPWL